VNERGEDDEGESGERQTLAEDVRMCEA
jgi:hypothetical protein